MTTPSLSRLSTHPSAHPTRTRSLPSLGVLLAVLVLMAAACSDSPTAPLDVEEVSPSTSDQTLSVWWPTEGVWLAGVQPFKARLEGWSLSRYRMYWQVDGGQLNEMWNSGEGGPHKEAAVDVGGWTWRGTGPYTVTFVAQTKKGGHLATRSLSVYVSSAPPPEDTTTTDTTTVSENPLSALPFWVDPYSNARKQADAWRLDRPADAELMDRIASQSQADWFGDWNSDVYAAVRDRTMAAASAGALAVLVAYNIPIRDCSGYSGGGASGPDAYRSWIQAFADGIGERAAAVVLEPDALALMDCLTSTQREERLALLREAVRILESQPNVAVYLDAGHSAWHLPSTMAARLRDAGIDGAQGFALNTSNFQTTANTLPYGDAISAEVGGKHYVVDTSRNGLGPTDDNQWCNPPGRGLGTNPTAFSGHPLADGFLWIKRPGESDGTCNGGPEAGAWWADYALELARNQPTVVASSD